MKKRKLFIVLSVLSLVLSGCTWLICPFILDNKMFDEYGMITIYESSFATAKLWWVILLHSPISIFTLFIGLKYKDRIVKTVSSVALVVIVSFSFLVLKEFNQYSTSNEYLIQIEESINYDFPEDSTILVEKKSSKDSNVIYEGIIRIPTNEEYINDLENNISWNNQIDSSITNYFSERFNFYVSSLNKSIYTFGDNNTLTFLAYQEEQNILFFTIIEMSEQF